MTEINKIRGKKSKASGARFELKVRKDLEKKGWIVSKWMNNVELHNDEDVNEFPFTVGKLVPAKHKFRGPGIPMSIGTGFPDFIAFKIARLDYIKKGLKFQTNLVLEGFVQRSLLYSGIYELFGVEVKSKGYLDKTEKEKCKWLMKNHIFSKILIASKGKKRGEIVYKEFK